jgi:hypothetical protein
VLASHTQRSELCTHQPHVSADVAHHDSQLSTSCRYSLSRLKTPSCCSSGIRALPAACAELRRCAWPLILFNNRLGLPCSQLRRGVDRALSAGGTADDQGEEARDDDADDDEADEKGEEDGAEKDELERDETSGRWLTPAGADELAWAHCPRQDRCSER